MSNTTAMGKDENQTSFNNKMNQEYQEAVTNGFKGTIEQYLQLRDFT